MLSEQEARDKVEIIELIARYGDATNREDFDGWAALFTPDGVFNGAYESFQAHHDLDRFKAESARLKGDWPNLRLGFTNVVSTVDGDTGTARSLLTMTVTHGKEVEIVFLAEYDDRLVRHEGSWRFAERTVTVIGD